MSFSPVAIAAVLLVAVSALGAAQRPPSPAVPWRDGERLTFDVRYSGINVAIQTMVASQAGDGWRFEAQLRPNLIMTLFYNATATVTSRVDASLRTVHFRKVTQDPHLGRRILTVSSDAAGRVVMDQLNGDGSRHLANFTALNLVDEVSLAYIIRIHPDAIEFTAIDFYRLVTGRIQHLPAREVSVPWGTALARGYAFSQGETSIEAWVQAAPPHFPLRVSYGQGWGSVTAVLRVAEP